MAGTLVARKRSRAKVKTGCATCRIRKIKCDENRPSCQKCVSTGRTCDGYESPFRIVSSQPFDNAHAGGITSSSTEIAPREIDLLNRYFSTKTMFDVKLGCDEEAKQVLQASLTDPSIRHAVSSLRALREDLEKSGDNPPSDTQTPSYGYGLQQYNMALRCLASRLSSPSSDVLRSALLCCQVFISIEQARGNFGAMGLHIIRGLRILHESRARPYIDAGSQLVRARHSQLPLLDVFLIKLFAAPCKFAEPSATANVNGSTACLSSPDQPRDHRTIAPNIRTELVKMATSTLGFLDKVSQVESVGSALPLRAERAALLASLASWLSELDIAQTQIGTSGPEPLSVSFMRFFHLILKVILLGALESSPDLSAELQTEKDRLQAVAHNVGERVKAHSIKTERANQRPISFLNPPPSGPW
ncbi:hypothetical protein FZEAL_5170 [Fusarium zealandicum]|uniref:Zn(2)-C6 fungal-type domain-containing protein n=1 Tax=Fusarium zealandicum TaxID=1053134 RepID=A0A8H4UK88_9HYPO|nr:hypothetical protein FZEAL_5170 [Fusarium zealandicum]